jgi:hypothetical protein
MIKLLEFNCHSALDAESTFETLWIPAFTESSSAQAAGIKK